MKCPTCHLAVHPTSDGFYRHTGLTEGPCGHRAMLDAEPEPGVDYEPAVCDNCGLVDHTPKQLILCALSMLGPPRKEEDDD